MDQELSPDELKRAKKRESMRKWWAANPGKAREYKSKRREADRVYAREYRAANPGKAHEYKSKYRAANPQRWLIIKSRSGAKSRGIEHTITVDDLQWPTHCPVLGIELNYAGSRGWQDKDNSPSFDRWDNDLGYIPGNVRVISWRANSLKKNGTWQELLAVARYARYGKAPDELADIW